MLLLAVPFFSLALMLVNRGLDRMSPDGLLGLELAGCGIYVYTLGLSIFRIRTAALSAEFVVTHADELEPKVYVVPEDIDREIARLKLEAEGVEIDTLTEEQAKYLASWDEGT